MALYSDHTKHNFLKHQNKVPTPTTRTVTSLSDVSVKQNITKLNQLAYSKDEQDDQY